MRARYLLTLLATAVVIATCGEEGIGPPELGEVDVALDEALRQTASQVGMTVTKVTEES